VNQVLADADGVGHDGEGRLRIRFPDMASVPPPAPVPITRTASNYDGVVMIRHFVTVACDFPGCLTRQG
jgi:hypothetical protein